MTTRMRIPRRAGVFLLHRPNARLFHATFAAQRKVLQKFKLADIGEGITECEVIKWNVQPPGTIAQFDQLCEVQSDKASVEITSPFDGVLHELLVKEGEVAKVGEPLCIIEVEDGVTEESGAPVEPVEQPQAPAEEPTPTPAHAPSPARDPAPISTPTPARKPHPMDPSAVSATAALSSSGADILALPSVRHFARQSGIDIAVLAPGSGKGGRVERSDVERYLAGGRDAPSSTETAKVADAVPAGEDLVVELGRTRHGMWKAMTKSLEIPHFGYTTYLDLTALDALLPALNTHIPFHYLPPPSPDRVAPTPLISPSSFHPAPSSPDVPLHARYTKLTYLPILLKTLSRAMHEWPLFRSSITPSSSPDSKPTMTLRPHADIAIGLSTPTGLYTPVIQRSDTRSIYAIASELRRVAHLGRQVPSALTPADMPRRGATITVSNVGAVGAGVDASPVLVPGGGIAIVALGRARWEVDVDRYDGARRLRLPVSWAADHRVVEGAELAAFVECWRSWVESPERMIGEGI